MGIFFSIICYYSYDFDDPIALIWIQIPGMLLGYVMGYKIADSYYQNAITNPIRQRVKAIVTE